MTVYQQNSMALADNPPFDCGLAPDPLKDLRDAIHLLANITEAFTVALYLREPGEDHLRPVVWHTLSGSFRSEDEVMLGEGLVGYVAKHQTVVDVDRFEDQATATRLYDEDEGIQAFLAMPVGNHGVLVGRHQNPADLRRARKENRTRFRKLHGQPRGPHADLRPRKAVWPHPGPAL